MQVLKCLHIDAVTNKLQLIHLVSELINLNVACFLAYVRRQCIFVSVPLVHSALQWICWISVSNLKKLWCTGYKGYCTGLSCIINSTAILSCVIGPLATTYTRAAATMTEAYAPRSHRLYFNKFNVFCRL